MFDAQDQLEKGALQGVGQAQATPSPPSPFHESNAETLTQATTISAIGNGDGQSASGHQRVYMHFAEDFDEPEDTELRFLLEDQRINNGNEVAFSSLNVRGSREDVEEYKSLLAKVETTFCTYTNLLATSQQMLSFAKPAEADRQNIGMYLHNRKPLRKDECEWVQHKEDLITLKPGREDSWLDGVVESALKLFHCRFIDFVFRSDDSRKKSEIDPGVTMPARPPKDEDRHEIYYTPSRIMKLMNGLHTCIILILLIVPIYVLYHMVHDIGTREAYMTCIGTLLVCTLAFSSILSLFTKAKRHEILAAASAYCAVLVVFLGNVESSRVGSGNKS
ncbi:hypothetical protein DM02DRAFT_727910 [Periconia macrospinosa]|uniref:DUF6594 domain-containing protein n=1 Tax=Periconia macrospinosa TaxID=97972 RepID=A0A2V1DTX0_9PLEO|nr:hypothetical protein DM02DRAFT_727910 [Periconia macrospinosa]